jgi:hypothetical protein
MHWELFFEEVLAKKFKKSKTIGGVINGNSVGIAIYMGFC